MCKGVQRDKFSGSSMLRKSQLSDNSLSEFVTPKIFAFKVCASVLQFDFY